MCRNLITPIIMNPYIEGGEVPPLVQAYKTATDDTVGPVILHLSHIPPRRTLSCLTCNSSARPSSMSSNLLLSAAARPSEYLTFF